MEIGAASEELEAIPISALRGRIRDFTDALGQQMFFWGRDVLHPSGNLLREFGFDRRASEGLDGTSCYRLERHREGDRIELHGACVGRYGREGDGFLFVRTRRRCYRYFGSEPPVPGKYEAARIGEGSASELYRATIPFLRWWLAYEDWIAGTTEPGYRDSCHRMWQRLPRARPWLPPGAAHAWLREYAENPGSLRRAREWKREGRRIA